jgi:hypothetical protein
LPSEAEDGADSASDPDAATTQTDTQFNGLGLFSLSVPETGLGVGSFVYFSEGRTFTGTITGLADPERQTLIGLLRGQFDIITASIQASDDTFGDFSATFTEPGGFANGVIRAEFVTGGAVVFGSTALGIRLEGEASMEISNIIRRPVRNDNGTPGDTTDDFTTQETEVIKDDNGSLTLVVDGFQQSNQSGAGTTDLTTFGGG